jgi:hypothetical protein
MILAAVVLGDDRRDMQYGRADRLADRVLELVPIH